jgi:hypothetical protein
VSARLCQRACGREAALGRPDRGPADDDGQPIRDGTCGRGCSHVSDRAAINLSALRHLPASGPGCTPGLGFAAREGPDRVGKTVARARAGVPIETIAAAGIRDPATRRDDLEQIVGGALRPEGAAVPQSARESSHARVLVASLRQRHPANGALPPALPAFGAATVLPGAPQRPSARSPQPQQASARRPQPQRASARPPQSSSAEKDLSPPGRRARLRRPARR